MFNKSGGSFRDLAVFSAFLILFNSLVESGYGQQGLPALPSGVTAASGHSSAATSPMQPTRFGTSTLRKDSPAMPGAGSSFRKSEALPASLTATSERLAQSLAQSPGSMSASVPPSAGAAVAASTDPNYSSSGFHLRERQPQSKIKYLSSVPKPNHAIGKPLRPMQLQGPDDPTDPYITAEASALGHDPQQIFNFLRDKVGYQAYVGSLRGARGTLWSLAGNRSEE